MIRVELPELMSYFMLDIYVATPETWATLLLIRTGSRAHNIKLCARARAMGMRLHADGSGLFRLQAKINLIGGVEYTEAVRNRR